ncbi:MAG: N-6 DNA methylase [Bacteroidales bacterium]|jgi:type I restriction enzyme M protein|nr:N-6 DNA methylase [Bacteroidales bacterium]
MDYKKFLTALGFTPKEKAADVFSKKYQQAGGYCLEVDLQKQIINYGNKIKSENKTTQNFSQPENFVVLECVNRLLEKGYQPQHIILEKTFPLGHNSGRLDILVTREEDDTAYLMIECKTYGKEFDKAFKKMKENGGQLFTYFQQDKNADVLMLYTSELTGEDRYQNEIVRIEEDYRQTSNIDEFFDRWNKLTKDNGIFETWVTPYNFESRALTPEQLKPIQQEDSSFIFNSFLEILRHNVVSDKPNAFNKIFTLFLCKIYDEKNTKPNEELKFQWLEGKDDDISFQIRLTDLYKAGMRDFLEKEVTDFSEDDFETEYKNLDEKIKQSLLLKINKIRLEKNNEFAIKEVFDEKSFKENAKIVKEVVELLQGFRLRYNKRQQYLSDFFELLLTTGLKQETGQFFTPVPIAQFIIKSLPIDKIVNEKLDKGTNNELLPYLIDYAAGSGHFMTESMHEIQRLIDEKNPKNYIEGTAKKIKTWQNDHFDWATQYIYGVEKDYRLVKVGKVGCYLHGDGLANVILSDGLANFDHPEYKRKLKVRDSVFPKENKQFEIVVSNPPYSVSAFKNTARKYYSDEDFELYDYLTDSSSEIECLFIERTKQLLKDGGVAGIILPSSILSNEGIYTKAREIILQNFEIIAITELGSNTFMATGTNTVVLFLRRLNNYHSINLQKNIDEFFTNFQDVALNKTEKPFSKYVQHVWKTITFDDYVSLIKNKPNKTIENLEFYKNYRKSVEDKIKSEISAKTKNRKTQLTDEDIKKIKDRIEKECWNTFIDTEKEKLLYFILAYPQQVVLVKTGEKDAEKRFLGYGFSNRRGSEGIHSIQGSRTISECTRLFDEEIFDNPEKASTYIYKAFSNDYEFPIDESLKDNISRTRLVDMLNFDRAGFAKSISTSIKKKVEIESKWDIVNLNNIVSIVRGASPRPIREYTTEDKNGINWIKIGDVKPNSKYITETKEKITIEGANKSRYVKQGDFILSNSMSFGRPYIMKTDGCIHDGWLLLSDFSNKLNKDYLYYVLSDSIAQEQFIDSASGGTSVDNLNIDKVSYTKIPLPPKEIQQKIVLEIEVLEKKEAEAKKEIEKLSGKISEVLDEYFSKNQNIKKLGDAVSFKRGPFGGSLKKEIFVDKGYKVYEQQHAIKNDFSIGKYYITEEKFKEMKGFELVEGDLIMSCSGTIGKIAVFPKNAEKGIINQALLRFRPIANLTTTSYLKICLSYITNKFEDNSHGTGLKNVASVETLKKIDIYCPPLSEQKKIVSQIEKIEAQITEAQKIIDVIPAQKNDVLKKYL